MEPLIRRRPNQRYYCYSCEKLGLKVITLDDNLDIFCRNCGSDFIQILDESKGGNQIIPPEQIPTYFVHESESNFIFHLNIKNEFFINKRLLICFKN